jgi:putative serine protease PepD
VAMTEKQPHQPHHQPRYYGAEPTSGSTPGDGTQQQYGGQRYGYGQDQYGPQGQQFGTTGAYQGTPPAGPTLWPGTPSGQGPSEPRTSPGGDGPKRRGIAILATTALLVGAAGGVGGAAVFSALDDPATGGGSVTAPLTNNSAAPIAAPDGSVQKAAQNVLPSVVKIGVMTQQGAGSGSGIVLTADGLIVTNNHVVEPAAQGGKLTVTFNDGKTATAQIVGRDPLTDLAVIRADAKGLKPAALGSSGQLQVGQQVVAIGSPFGLEATVTSGIVSALDRPVTSGDAESDSTTVFPAVQTDAAINPGNSGGALIDLAGRVVGINSSIKTAGGGGQGGNIGLGFAIPVDQAKPIIDELVRSGKATHARLGVTVGDAGSSDGLATGAQIGEVTPGGAADKAGLKAGDVVVTVDSKAIASGDALVAAVRSHRPGDKVTLQVKQGGSTKDVTVTLASDNGNPTG